MTQQEKSAKFWPEYLKSKYGIEPGDIGHEPADKINIEEVERLALKYDLDATEKWNHGRAQLFCSRFRIKLSEVL